MLEDDEEEEIPLRWVQKNVKLETPGVADRETFFVHKADGGEERKRKGKGRLISSDLSSNAIGKQKEKGKKQKDLQQRSQESMS
ncbi:hypothetical protein H5410_045104 [Solanum commersonii]|uniref:Uncharacterized protein n=1 Tax=Solanum commersonii TaxID=4109 RepID=A0A9J5XBP1_SOLCO|nr:hypothetical protein H5410_045104 [Solanum commersonii]